jgi:hypothetical protein
MEHALHQLPHGKAVWLSHEFMMARLGVGLVALFLVGWRLVRADLIPDLFATRGAVGPGRRSLFDRWTRHYDGTPAVAAALEARIRRLAPAYVVLYAIVFSLVLTDHGAQPHCLQPARRVLFLVVPGRIQRWPMMMYGAAQLESPTWFTQAA